MTPHIDTYIHQIQTLESWFLTVSYTHLEGESAISITEKSDFFIPRDKDCWTDLENALTFDYRKYITQCIDAFDRDIDVNNYETSIAQMNSTKQFFKDNPQDIARDFTNNWFWKWIAREYYSNIEDICYKNSNDSIHAVSYTHLNIELILNGF